MKYITRPKLVEAVQWSIKNGKDIEGVQFDPFVRVYFVKAGASKAYLKSGDYIVTEETGEKFVCAADAFEKTYVGVSDG